MDLIDKLKINPFIDGPTEALVKATAFLISEEPKFKSIFSDNIDVYERFDYSVRQLPALRVYNLNYKKEQESHYINGELNLDILYPASLRRPELQSFQDILSAALLQQFRRPNYFERAKELVPGLNELGKIFEVDKTLGMRWEEGYIPITQMKANFRIDLKVWDDYLESTYRTKDYPFEKVLGDLKRIVGPIVPVHDNSSPETAAQQDIDMRITTQGD